MKLNELKTIDVYGKEWKDTINGVSYFSSRVVLNLEYENELIIEIPFQNGYEEQYLSESMEAVKYLFPTSKWCKNNISTWEAKSRYGFIVRNTIQKNCKKKELNHSDGYNYCTRARNPIPARNHKQWSNC